jgi:hypothetical protein
MRGLKKNLRFCQGEVPPIARYLKITRQRRELRENFKSRVCSIQSESDCFFRADSQHLRRLVAFVIVLTSVVGQAAFGHPLARSLANLEAVIGQLFPATLLARIVTLEIAAERRH